MGRYGIQNALILLIVGLFLIAADWISIAAFRFNAVYSLILVFVSLLIYLLLLLFLSSYSRARKERRGEIRFEEEKKPVTVHFTRGDDNKIAEDILKEIEADSNKDAAPYYDYVGSTRNKTYHLRTCRLAKNIKPKFRLEDTNIDFFKKRKFKACKICLKKRK